MFVVHWQLLQGSSGVAMASAVNHYLKYYCNAQALSWSGSQVRRSNSDLQTSRLYVAARVAEAPSSCALGCARGLADEVVLLPERVHRQLQLRVVAVAQMGAGNRLDGQPFLFCSLTLFVTLIAIVVQALNGINLPLAFLGQEKIWLSVWSQLGLRCVALFMKLCVS